MYSEDDKSPTKLDGTTINVYVVLHQIPNELTSSHNSSVDAHPSQLTETDAHTVPKDKPVIVGIYGIPGSGKTFLLDQVKQKLRGESYEFYEGPKVIDSLVPGGLAGFQKLDDIDKLKWRQTAIDTIRKNCSDKGRTGVVAGHFMFWSAEDCESDQVYTSSDWRTFTHILYLHTPISLVAQHRQNDSQRFRSSASNYHLKRWQQTEETELRKLCRQHNILFSLVSSTPSMLPEKITSLLHDFRYHTEKENLRRAESRLDDIIVGYGGETRLDTVLVMDADRTLNTQDTGKLFWETLSLDKPQNSVLRDTDDPLKEVFSSQLGYSYAALFQATLLYEEATDDDEFDEICEKVASMVTIHPEFALLLRRVAKEDHVAAVIVTHGLRHVWDKILVREGLSGRVKVIGGGRITDGFVVTASVQTAIVVRLRDVHHMYILGFGDSQLDIGMLSEAHEAIVVVGEEASRSKTMEKALQNSIDDDGLRARQVLLPAHQSPRLDTDKLPLVQIDHEEFIQSILRRRKPATSRIVHATNLSEAKVLMTPMRDAMIAGPALRAAHGHVGWYLATKFVTEIIGLEEYAIPHVQGHQSNGYRLRHEKQTAIVALMRGGEPMAFGVNEAFPSAMFVHATKPFELKPHHLHKRHTVLLVDSVVNSGKSVVEFIQHIRRLDATICIIVVAGTVQANSLTEGPFAQALERDINLSLVALRLSENKFTGSGVTDTGNRLFNTTHLP
jgi:uracil phosphoribosyltransferase/phosphoserine phosphatase/adenylylsulfate kinase-like enzyme